MAFIKTVDPEIAEGIVRQEYDKGIHRSGRVFNILKIMSLSPAALKESMRMYLAIMYGESELSRCLLYTSPSPRDRTRSRMPSSA